MAYPSWQRIMLHGSYDMKENIMKTKLTWFCTALVVLSLALSGCSDDDKSDTTTDGGKKDGGKKLDGQTPPDKGLVLPDGYKLWKCTTPGAACNAHDPCAIDPICGKDLYCRPTKLQNCSDDLDCTTDTCAGLGVCTNTPKAGKCALAVRVPKGTTCAQVTGGKVKFDAGVTPDTGSSTSDATVDTGSTSVEKETIFCCFKKGDRSPTDQCEVCNPATGDDSGTGGNSKKWSPANGGSCDDGNLCTKNDYCQYGTCKGSSFSSQCSDGYGCTQDLCDGKGGCLGNPMKPGFCLINATCYKDGQMHPSGSCSSCDSKKNPADWTTVTATCMISGKCYKKGDKDTTGCNICDPKSSATAWTPISGLCSIGGKCYKPKDKNTGGCAECDPTTSQTKWTVKGSTDCLIGGKCYKALATDATGCKECAPASNKYDWSSVANTCLISGKCYKKNAKHSGACATCLPATNAKGWTVTGSDCLINNTCYKPKAKDSSGCGECIPAYDKYKWSVTTTGKCLIKGSCVASGTKDSSGCATCDPTKSKTSWTPSSNKCVILGDCISNAATDKSACLTCKVATSKTKWTPAGSGTTTTVYDYETGKATGWTLTNSDKSTGWHVTKNRKYEGQYSLYYGHPTKKNYDTGAQNYGKAISPAINLTSSKKAGLHLRIYMDVESLTSYDTFIVRANTTNIWQKGVNSTTMKKWLNVYIDLSKYAGTSVKIKFDFDTKDSYSNTTEGIFVDAMVVYEGC